jgi:hypothetical protein
MTLKYRSRTPAERAALLEAVTARVKNATPEQKAALELRRKAAREANSLRPDETP